jgi:hypothetical protein
MRPDGCPIREQAARDALEDVGLAWLDADNIGSPTDDLSAVADAAEELMPS